MFPQVGSPNPGPEVLAQTRSWGGGEGYGICKGRLTSARDCARMGGGSSSIPDSPYFTNITLGPGNH